MDVRLSLRSAIPGRERWVVEGLRGRSILAERLEERLRSVAGLGQVRANAGTERVLVSYDPAALSGGVGEHLEAALRGILAQGLPAEVPPRRESHPFFEILRRARPEPALLAVAPMATVVGSVLNLLPYLGHSGSISVTRSGGSSFLARLGLRSVKMHLIVVAGATLSLMVVNLVFENFRRRLWRRLASRIEQRLQVLAIEQILRLDMSYLEDQKTGGLMRLVQGDTGQIYALFENGLHDVLQKLTLTVLIGLILFAVSPGLAFITFAPFPVVLLASRYFQTRVQQRFAAAGGSADDFWQVVANSFAGAPTIKSFTAEPSEIENALATSERALTLRFAAFEIGLDYTNLIRLLTAASFTLSIMFGGMLFADGAISFTVYSLVLLTVPQLTWVVGGLDESYDMYQRSLLSARRLVELYAREPQIVSGPVRLPRAAVRGDIEIRGVRFAYVPEAPVFQDLTLTARPYETTALVGPTGSGKTTVVKLLMRYYDADAGSIVIDGVDLRALDLDDVRKAIGYVSQDVYLFHGTVAENIAYGRRDATRAEIEEAAQIAEAHEFIQRLPHGYETIVGERGQKLSGGQRQRVSIARAVLKDPPILVLDEATSALDSETEAAIQRSMRRIAQGRTTIVIAHRLSTVQDAACIYVIDEGAVREKGTHRELLELGRLYAALWNIQSSSLDN